MQPELVDGKECKLVTRIDKNRVGAVDWTFNVDKSVSLAELVAGDTRIAEVRSRAEAAAMDFIESQVRVKVRKASEVSKGKPKTWKFPERFTDNLLYAGFRHATNRDGAAHGHTHYVIWNLSYDKQEGIFKAVDLRRVDRKGANDVYRKELRQGLNELGYKTRKVGQEFEITGFPAEIKSIFSQRHESIKEMERDYEARAGKPMGSKAKGKLSVYNRPEKPNDMPLKDRRIGWLARLSPGQYKAVASVVSRAKLSVGRKRWAAKLKNHVAKLRSLTILREGDSRESVRTRSNGRSR